jgi:hypothetical protein
MEEGEEEEDEEDEEDEEEDMTTEINLNEAT